MQATFALLWHPKEENGIHWYIRGIRPDGSFYGEARSPRAGIFVEGQIPPDDWARCTAILDQIASGPPIEPVSQWTARIGRWRKSLSDCEIVRGYRHGDETETEEGALFFELKGLLEKQVSKFYPSIA